MVYFRGKLMRCEHLWKDECRANPITTQHNVTMEGRSGNDLETDKIGCYPGVTGDNVSQRMDLFEYCKAKRSDMPTFWLVGSAESHPNWCEINSPIQKEPYIWCRIQCHPFTCYFAKGGSPDFKVGAWQLWFANIVLLLITLTWWSNCFPMCWLCFWFSAVRDKEPSRVVVDGQRSFDAFTGCGTLPYYFMWFWAAWLPLWLAMYVTFVEGGFEQIMPKVALDWSMFTVLFSDMKNLAISVVVLVGLVLLYINRQVVFQALGIDDRYILHWKNLFGQNIHDKQTVLQICVWKVDSMVQGEKSESQGTMTNMMKGLTCSRRVENHGRATLDLTSEGSLFVRIAYGHNEPLNGRVVRVPATYGANKAIMFKEIFKLNYEDSGSLDEQPPLFLELQKQDVAGRQDLGRVKMTPHRIREILEEQCDHPGLARRQVMHMLGLQSPRGETLPLITAEAAEREDGKPLFFSEPLASGGTIWYAIAEIGEEDEEA